MAPETRHFIGGGSGGSGTARRTAGLGVKTAIVDAGISGGCCVNVGCIPKKMTWNLAFVRETIHKGQQYGFTLPEGGVSFNYKDFVEKRDAHIKVLNSIYERNWSNEGINLHHAHATFVGEKELEISPLDGSASWRCTFDHCTIATGSFPLTPTGIKGSEYGITSDDFFSMRHLPRKMVIVGGGYIAVELAGMMNALGVETHLFIRGKTFLRKFDYMVQDLLTHHYEKSGVHIHREHPGIREVVLLHAADAAAAPRDKTLKIITNNGEELLANELLWAIGRSPETRGLGLERLSNMKLGKQGQILVDMYQNTSVDGIYALGDVTGQAELTPVAVAAGRRLGNRLFGGPKFKDSHLEYDLIPTVVFAHPTVGTSGLTQQQAEAKYGKEQIKVYQTNFNALFYEVFPSEQKKQFPTSFKLICANDDEKIVGMHILGDGTDEMLQGFGVALKMGATKADFDSCVAIHPTSAEELVTMK